MKNTTEITRAVMQRRDEWQQVRTARRRVLTRSMAMLAVALALCGGAAASGNGWFTSFFEGFRNTALSGEQAGIAARAEAFEPRTVVSGDWSVTIDQGISDGHNYYLRVTVIGPEDRAISRLGCGWRETVLQAGTGEPDPVESVGTWFQPEETGLLGDNAVRFVMHLAKEEPVDAPVTLLLKELVFFSGEPECWEQIGGTWLFEDLEFVDAGEAVELLAEPVTASCQSGEEEAFREIRLDSVRLRTFSIQVDYSEWAQVEGPDLQGQLVLKDGTVYDLYFSVRGDQTSGTMNALFGFPVLADEVDRILLGGVELEIP